jgi:hypothetical protein
MSSEQNEVREKNVPEEASSGEVEVRIDSADLSARPLSQFILAKQYEGITANAGSARPVTLVASVRPVGGKGPAARKSPRRYVSPCRVEYPLYDSDADSFPFPEPEENAVLVKPDSTEPSSEVSVSTPFPLLLTPRPVSAETVPSSSEAPGSSMRIRFGAVSADEAALPLVCDRDQAEDYPIFNRYLALVRLSR